MTYVPPRRSDGTLQRRREPLPWPNDRPFRILSIDGGGICGILPASVLAELESRFLGGCSAAGCFDMIAGTSTGGIIALGLSHGLSARDIQRFYIERGDRIFPPGSVVRRMWRAIRRLRRSAYDSAALEDELLAIFGGATLGDAKNRLCIPSFEGVHGEPWLFKTPHHPDYQMDRVERMVRVALATSAAPTYLRSLENNGYIMIDGGLWANNPIMNAVVDALTCFDLRRDQIRVLSLGCGETAFRVGKRLAGGGLIQWRKAVVGAMRAQSHNALGQTYLLLGKPNVVRLDMPASASPIAMDDHRRAVAELPDAARSLVEGAGHLIKQSFLFDRADAYAPCPAR